MVENLLYYRSYIIFIFGLKIFFLLQKCYLVAKTHICTYINIRSCNLVWCRLGILCVHLDPFGGSRDASLCVWGVVSLWLIFWVENVRYTLSQLVDLSCLSFYVAFSHLSFLALKSYLLFCVWSCLFFVDLLVILYFIFAKLIAWILLQQVVSKQFGIRSGVWAKFIYCFYRTKVYILFFFKKLWLQDNCCQKIWCWEVW